MSKRCKCLVLSFFVVDFLWISSDEHDSRFHVKSSLIQCQIPDAAIKGRQRWRQTVGKFNLSLPPLGCDTFAFILNVSSKAAAHCRWYTDTPLEYSEGNDVTKVDGVHVHDAAGNHPGVRELFKYFIAVVLK
ncbi:hypothetical protein J6590_101145 [Homalodisca vitripennis]|nr:hypothetical protein J6590_101145 [Homalodisca vitripennis]